MTALGGYLSSVFRLCLLTTTAQSPLNFSMLRLTWRRERQTHHHHLAVHFGLKGAVQTGGEGARYERVGACVDRVRNPPVKRE